MNKYDERYDIRIANRNDIDDIMRFIGSWKKNHILSYDRVLFEYDFVDGDRVNFVIAREKSDNVLVAILGFLYCSNSDSDLKRDVWGSFWKVADEEKNMSLLGVELAKRVFSLANCRMHIGSGANPATTIPLRKLFFREKTGKMKQYYLLNDKKNEFVVSRIVEKKNNDYIANTSINSVTELKSFEDISRFFDVESLDAYPYKDNWYIEKRYFKHPYYTYRVWGLSSENENEALVFAREIEVNGTKVLRIVDFIGNHESFSETGRFWRELIDSEDYEYIDFFEYGVPDEYILKAGFVLREEEDDNIIPDHFEPFEQKNYDIWVHYKYDGTTFFKGDCDQDRPHLPRSGR